MGITAGTGALIGGALSAGSSLIGGAMQSGNANKAAQQSQRNLQLILPQMQENYVNTLAQYQPYTETGQKGLTATTDLLGLNGPDAATAAMANYQKGPGYDWQFKEGLRAIEAGAAAGRLPGVDSGATRKAEETFGQGLANSDFGQYYNRLNALAGQGLTAASGVAAAGNSLIAGMEGNAQSQNAVNLGAANAQNSIIGNTTSGLGNTVNSLLQNKDVLNTIGGWFGSGSTGTNLPGSTGYNPNLTVGGYAAADNFF